MPEKPKIKRGKDQYGQEGDAYAVIDLYRIRGADVTEPIDTVEATVEAKIDHGRWIVPCPDPTCLNAQFVGDEDLRFYCVRCANVANDGKWLEIVWPPDADEIEDVLAVRPVDNRHWSPGDTVADLRSENVAHDLPEIWEG
jgi:hypothetical protein